MSVLPPYIIEQCAYLLRERETENYTFWVVIGAEYPIGFLFEKLVQILVFRCAYKRIADGSCSATTLRRRRDE